MKQSFNRFATLAASLRNDESGQDLIEYALVAALVGLGCTAAMKGLSTSIANTFTGVSTAIDAASI
jgi:pilus assembly protein Flp/PilA